jgi:hypothetical protein
MIEALPRHVKHAEEEAKREGFIPGDVSPIFNRTYTSVYVDGQASFFFFF